MPVLPRLASQSGLPSPAPQIAPETAFGGQAFDAVTQLGEVQSRLQDHADKTEAVRAIAEWQQEAKGLIQEHEQSITSPKEFEAAASKALQESHANRLKAGSNPHVRQMVENGLADNLIGANVLVRGAARKKLVDKSNADFLLAGEQLKNAAATASGENLHGIYQAYGDMLGNRLGNGLIKQEDAVKESQKFAVDVDKARAGHLAETDPRLLKATLNEKNYPNLSAEQRRIYDNLADGILRERELAVKEAEKKRVDIEGRKILQQAITPGTNLGKLQKDIAEREDLPLDFQIAWAGPGGKLEDQMKAKALADKVPDPYLHSDGYTLARVMSDVMAHPDRWDWEKINNLRGKGLSNAHADHVISTWDRMTKEGAGPAGTMTALKMAQDTWKKMLFELAFVDEEERGGQARFDPATLMKNSRQGQRVWDEVARRSDPNLLKPEDPRAVLEELAQPHIDKRVKEFFGYISEPEETRTRRIRAKQDLLREGIELTDENINQRMDALAGKTRRSGFYGPFGEALPGPTPAPAPRPTAPTAHPVRPANIQPATEAGLLRRNIELEQRNKELTEKLLEAARPK